jgi:REP element-mobilizing transposase RayT
MARKPRVQIADVIYHVTSRAVDKRPIFGVVSGDREFFLVLLQLVVMRCGWRLHAYCLMGNHFHLLVETPDANLAAGMQFLKSRYAIWFNTNTGREGALFERRYRSELVEREAHAYELTRYIVLNPVRAKLCAHPRDWRWSSYCAAIGAVRVPSFLYLERLHDLFGEGLRGIALYERFVEDGVALLRLQAAA